MNDTASSSHSPSEQDLDALTGGVFSAPTSGERAARLRDWLNTEPSVDALHDVFKLLSHRDKGAAKPLREKLDEVRRQRQQESLALEWAEKAQQLLAANRFVVADAMAWQRDAAKAGAPLSREPLAELKTALAERVRAIEDVQHRVLVEREAAVLLAQRIEVLSTKPWRDAQAARAGLQADVQNWMNQCQAVQADAHWPSVEPKLPGQLEASQQQLRVVWDAFDAALSQAVAADADAQAPLPAVPVWADELRSARGDTGSGAGDDGADDAASQQAKQARRSEAADAITPLLAALTQQLSEGHGKATAKVSGDLRAALKQHGRFVPPELDAQVQAALAQAGELEGWQRWRADQLRTELVAKAEALLSTPPEQRLGGRKMQETLRQLREQWKTTDQGGVPNHALWKRFDEACNLAHKVVEEWLLKVREQAEQNKAQRQALMAEVEAWITAHQDSDDWKAQQRELHALAERWRSAGHLSEKLFAELQPQWKDVMQRAHARLDAAQAESLVRRRALIEEAKALGEAPMLRLDAVKALQQQWQHEAQTVALDRKQEQKLWEAFRSPIDEAFKRKDQAREKAQAAMSEHDQHVLAAAKAVDEANASGDAQRIRTAVAQLQAAMRGDYAEASTAPASTPAPTAEPAASPAPAAEAAAEPAADATSASSAAAEAATETSADAPTAESAASAETSAEMQVEGAATEDAAAPSAEAVPAPAPAPAAPRKVVAVRGDDRPGMKKAEVAPPGGRRDGPRSGPRDGGRPGGRDGRRDGRDGRGDDQRSERFERGPRLGDAAFRAQRDALDKADAALRKLAAQAHGEVLTRVLTAWEKRDAAELPSAQELGRQVNAATRSAWVQALESGQGADHAAQALLRLEMAADVPTPAEQLNERRQLQLQLLTRRNEAPPQETWAQDAAAVLASGHDAAAARRLQSALKVLMRK